jgi:hypothetical protein
VTDDIELPGDDTDDEPPLIDNDRVAPPAPDPQEEQA